MNKFHFWLDRPGYSRNFALHVAFDCSAETRSLSKPLEFEKFEQDHAIGYRPAALELTPTDAQALMDELYRAGIRPTRMENSAGALGATERHLKDMQTIAFGVLATEVRMANEFRQNGDHIHQQSQTTTEVKAP